MPGYLPIMRLYRHHEGLLPGSQSHVRKLVNECIGDNALIKKAATSQLAAITCPEQPVIRVLLAFSSWLTVSVRDWQFPVRCRVHLAASMSIAMFPPDWATGV